MATVKRPGFDATVDSTPSYSVVNSSTVAIDDGSNFTGEWEEVGLYQSVVVAVSTDQNGYYEVQFSPDGSNADSTLTRYYRTDLINAPHRFTVTRKYARIRFFNDSGVNQTYFRLQVSYGDKAPLNVPLSGTVSGDYDATVVRPTDFDNEVVLGLRQGVSPFLKFGYNDDIDSTEEVVASFGGTFTPISTATTLTIVSDSTDDASAGTGARTLFIEGLDSARRYQFEVVVTNGTTNVVTSNTWMGVNRIVVLSSGSGQTNAGTITCTATTGGTNQAQIPAGTGVTQQLIFHNQDGFYGLIKKVTVNVLKTSGGSSPKVTVKLNVWNPKVTDSTYVIRRYKVDTDVSNDLVRIYDVPVKLDPTDVLWVTADTDQNNTAVDGEVHILEARQAST